MKIIETKKYKGATHQSWSVKPLGHSFGKRLPGAFSKARHEAVLRLGWQTVGSTKKRAIELAKEMHAHGYKDVEVHGVWAESLGIPI